MGTIAERSWVFRLPFGVVSQRLTVHTIIIRKKKKNVDATKIASVNRHDFIHTPALAMFSHELYARRHTPSATFWTTNRGPCTDGSPPRHLIRWYPAWGSAFPLLVDFDRRKRNHFFVLATTE